MYGDIRGECKMEFPGDVECCKLAEVREIPGLCWGGGGDSLSSLRAAPRQKWGGGALLPDSQVPHHFLETDEIYTAARPERSRRRSVSHYKYWRPDQCVSTFLSATSQWRKKSTGGQVQNPLLLEANSQVPYCVELLLYTFLLCSLLSITLHALSYRKLYLVVDGNSLPNNHADSVLPIYAPMSIFGEYYLELNDAQGKLPHPIHRSPYCRPQSAKRPFLSPSLPRKRKNPTVAFPLSGHRLVEEKGASHQNESGLEAYTVNWKCKSGITVTVSKFTILFPFKLLLSVLLHGDIGNIHADLPHSVVSEFQGYNVTVEIPSQNKKFSRSRKWHNIILQVLIKTEWRAEACLP